MSLQLHVGAPLKDLNTFHIEARAARLASAGSVSDLIALSRTAEWRSGPRLILGGGSNILFVGDFEGLVVRIALRGIEVVGENEHAVLVRAAAGESWDALVEWTLAAGHPGLENLIRIPGTVGAAPIQNIGAYGLELAERFAELEAFDPQSGEVLRMDRAACRFRYRDSIFKSERRDLIITAVTLRLPKVWKPVVNYKDVLAALQARGQTAPSAADIAAIVAALRAAKLPDPSELGNVGSFFKNPVVSAARHRDLLEKFPGLVGYLQSDGSYKLAAAWLIEQCGWKGRALGPVAVHDKQALVLVNCGGATGEQVLTLSRAIEQSVHSRFAVELEREPVVV